MVAMKGNASYFIIPARESQQAPAAIIILNTLCPLLLFFLDCGYISIASEDSVPRIALFLLECAMQKESRKMHL